MTEESRRKEDERLYGEYIFKEFKDTIKILETVEERIERGEKISFADFYPEWNLRERMPYTCYHNPDIDIPLWVVLPYYNTVIVDIRSDLPEQEFKREYGVGVEELFQLKKEGKVVMRLDFPPAERISNYLRPVYEEALEKGIPTNLRGFLLPSSLEKKIS